MRHYASTGYAFADYAAVRKTLELVVAEYRRKREDAIERNGDRAQVSRLRRQELLGDYLRSGIKGREGPIGTSLCLETTIEEAATYLRRFGIERANSTIQIDAQAIMRAAGVRLRFREEECAQTRTAGA